MGIEGVEEMHPESPRPDNEVVEEQRRQEEGVEPAQPTPAPDTAPPEEREPVSEPSPPNPGGGFADTETETDGA